jgi:hypothetical protein
MILKTLAYLLTALATCQPAPELAELFTPPHPLVGRYEACTTPEPIARAASADFNDIAFEVLEPLDAFGSAGLYDRFAVARLYGGTRATVGRGWVRRGEEFESWTFISPYPDATLTHLVPGTLIIKLRLAAAYDVLKRP